MYSRIEETKRHRRKVLALNLLPLTIKVLISNSQFPIKSSTQCGMLKFRV